MFLKYNDFYIFRIILNFKFIKSGINNLNFRFNLSDVKD